MDLPWRNEIAGALGTPDILDVIFSLPISRQLFDQGRNFKQQVIEFLDFDGLSVHDHSGRLIPAYSMQPERDFLHL